MSIKKSIKTAHAKALDLYKKRRLSVIYNCRLQLIAEHEEKLADLGCKMKEIEALTHIPMEQGGYKPQEFEDAITN